MARAIIAGLTDNPAFPARTVDLKIVRVAADELNATLSAQAQFMARGRDQFRLGGFSNNN
jgi:hypothetical protein